MVTGQIGENTANVIHKRHVVLVLDQEKGHVPTLHQVMVERIAMETSERNLFAETRNALVVILYIISFLSL